jgi:hypothetical protein
MDGAIISGNCVSACDKNTTYHHQNNPVVADLFAQHGKTLNYVCNIITNENVYLADKQRSSDWSFEAVPACSTWTASSSPRRASATRIPTSS